MAVLGVAGFFGFREIKQIAAESAGKVESTSTNRKGDGSTKDISATAEVPFETKVKESGALRVGTSSVVQKGVPGEKIVTYTVTYKDGQEVSRKVKREIITKRPLDEITVRGTFTPPPDARQ